VHVVSPLSLRVSPLWFHLETMGPFRVPEYKGALFRGGFGQYFREMVCVTRAPVCTDCPHLSTCPYSTVFETPVLPDQFTVLRKYPNAPHPFVLVPPLDQRTALPPGTSLELGVSLIGRGIDYLPHFIQVLEGMGRDGRYGGRFRLRSVVSAVAPGRLVYDGMTRRFAAEPPLWQAEEPAGAVRRMVVEFVTPLRMRTEGRYNRWPDFVQITQALLRRIHLLREIYGETNGDADWTHGLLRQADGVKTVRADFRMYAWDRMSGRQGRRVQMDGVVGVLEAEGELTELAGWWRMGEWLSVGSGTSMGMGRYRMRVEG
jgi:CRISPR/Cas system endoribonuclease Cas6 (RAMP superfamily)